MSGYWHKNRNTERDNINACKTEENSSFNLSFDNSFPVVMPDADRTIVTQLLNSRDYMFASKAEEFGKTGLVKHYIKRKDKGPFYYVIIESPEIKK